MHMLTYIYTHTHTHIRGYFYVRVMYICIHVFVIETWLEEEQAALTKRLLCLNVYVYTCIYACTHVYIYIYINTHI